MKLNRTSSLATGIVVLFIIAIQTPTLAQQDVNTILTAVPFLRIIQDAKSGAMGDVGIALAPAANSMQTNSSKLAFIKNKGGVSLNYTPWLSGLALNDVFLAYTSGYYSPDDKQTFGAALRFFSLGKINFTDINGEPVGSGNPKEYELALSYNRKLSDKFALGISPKFIFSDLASDQTFEGVSVSAANIAAVDLSGTYISDFRWGNTNGNFTLGGAISNLGYKVSYTDSEAPGDYLPTNLGLGTALQLDLDEFNALTIAMDVNKLLVPTPSSINETGNPNVLDYKEYSSIGGAFASFGDAPGGFSEEVHELMYSFGIEYLYNEKFALRAGYYTEHQTKGGRNYFTTGLGMKFNIFGINISYLIPKAGVANPLDNTFRFSLLFDFGNSKVTE